MQPQEVAGLQQLAQANGTSLTTNPMTGYPEAFNLGNMFRAGLPILAGYLTGGAATPFLGAGTATASAITAGAATGAGLAAMSGEDVLAGGLSGGLGGYSGMGLETALGGSAIPAGGGAGAGSTVNPALVSGSAPITSTASAGSIGSFNPALDSTLTTAGGGAAPLTQGSVFDPSINPGASTLDTIKQNLGSPEIVSSTRELSTGINPQTGEYIRATGNITPGDNIDVAMKLGSPAVSMGLGGLEASDFYNEPDFSDPRDKYDPYSKLNLNKDTGVSDAMRADTGLRLFAQGGYLKGPGDGMSDDIPANIDGNQPAALSTGEYVVSADVVSGLGNGSSEAGAKRLHAMMDRVRKATTGRKAQATEINPSKYMPA